MVLWFVATAVLMYRGRQRHKRQHAELELRQYMDYMSDKDKAEFIARLNSQNDENE
uniref:Uncharacterized protein n=1 Tax=Ciona intestinalis TaxID=7719 RepID=H2XST7_CIOIN